MKKFTKQISILLAAATAAGTAASVSAVTLDSTTPCTTDCTTGGTTTAYPHDPWNGTTPATKQPEKITGATSSPPKETPYTGTTTAYVTTGTTIMMGTQMPDDTTTYNTGTHWGELTTAPVTGTPNTGTHWGELTSAPVTGTPNTGTHWEEVTTTTEEYPMMGEPMNSYGDVNNDGEVDLSDLSELALYILREKEFTQYQKNLSDMNGDGEVTIADLAYLKLIVIKVIN